MGGRPSQAFTLIELLVVIGVIGALAALLLPVTHKVRATARETRCRANLRQVGQAVSLYMDDHNECIPRRGQGEREVNRIDRASDWFNCLLLYMDSPPYCELVAQDQRPNEGDNHVLICPAARDPGWLYFFPYAMNMYLSPWARPRPHRISEIPWPCALVFMADAPGPYSSTIPSSRPFGVVPRHGGRANLVFLDSHVGSFEGAYLGCGSRPLERGDARWDTGTKGINWEPKD